jgi:hypothetical protein
MLGIALACNLFLTVVDCESCRAAGEGRTHLSPEPPLSMTTCKVRLTTLMSFFRQVSWKISSEELKSD